MRLAIKFAYDGKQFHGYARQPSLKTVEGELLKALVKHSYIEDTKESIFRSASRTDKNVSALGNVVAFNTEASKKQIIDELSNESSSILVYGIKEVKHEFYPRHAKQRHYRYYLHIKDLDLEKIISTSAIFTGENDFSNFAKLEPFKDPIRTIDNILFTLENDFLIIDFFAKTYLWHQIRRIISSLIKIGNGTLEEEQIIGALKSPENKVDFGLAPAEPLILKDVLYDFEFEYDKNLMKKVKNLEKNLISQQDII
jgi:tRNA pseudouridine38-40 synthase